MCCRWARFRIGGEEGRVGDMAWFLDLTEGVVFAVVGGGGSRL